jgi:hypothetical protein
LDGGCRFLARFQILLEFDNLYYIIYILYNIEMEPKQETRELGKKSNREERPNREELRQKRLRAFETLPAGILPPPPAGILPPPPAEQPSPETECGICSDNIVKDGFSHCKYSHNHKECVKTWIKVAMRNNNANANKCMKCFKPYNETQLNELGLNKAEIDTLLERRPADPIDVIKTIIDEIMQGNFQNINDLQWNFQQPRQMNELVDYFKEKNIARLRSPQIRANIVLLLNSQRVQTINNVNKEDTIESFTPIEYANKHLNSVGLYDTSNSTSYDRANFLPIDILNNIGIDIFRKKIRGQDRNNNKLFEYMNQTVFDIYVGLEDPEGIDGYVRPAPCKGSGCNIMGGNKNKRTSKKKRGFSKGGSSKGTSFPSKRNSKTKKR